MNQQIRRFPGGNQLWGFIAFSVAVTFAVFGRALAFPLITDDVYLLRGMESLDLPDLFTHTKSFPWYRPMSLISWKIIETLTGHYSPMAMHLVNITTHAINGILVALLSKRLYADRPAVPWLTMTFFLLFPFSGEAVAWSAANGHLFVATGALVAIYTLDLWLDHHKRSLLGVIWVAVFFTVFSHENGSIVPVLMGLWLVYRRRPLTVRTLFFILGPVMVILITYVLIWLYIPKPDAPTTPLDGFFYSLLYFYQGLTVPFAQFGGALAELSGIHGDLIALGLVGSGLVVLAWGSGPIFRLGLAWYSLAIIIPAIFLDAHQNVGSPRYMVLASVGASLTWAVLVNALYNKFTSYYRLVPVALALVIIGGGVRFIHNYLSLYEEMESVYRVVYETAEDDKDAVFFNLPGWFGYDRSDFGIGREGIKYLYDSITLSEFAYYNTQHRQDLPTHTRASITPVIPERSWGLVGEELSLAVMAATIRDLGRAFTTKLVGDYWGWESIVAVPDAPFDDAQTFENGMRLIASPPEIIADGVVEIALAWQVGQPPETIDVFVHLACNEEVITSQADGAPLRGLYPFSLWPPGAQWQETRLMQIGDHAPEACYIRVGLYNPLTGLRIALQDGREFLVIDLNASQ